MDRWMGLEAFVRIAEDGNMSKAAEALDMSVSGVSRHLMNLEQRLGVRLINRSTRQLFLTSEGERYLVEVKEILSHLREAEDNVASSVSNPRGNLRIGSSLSFSLLHLVPIVPLFIEKYPNVKIDLVASNRYYDIIENGLDLAIRTRRVESDSSITIRRLAETKRILAASPSYLKSKGIPRHPEDLKNHNLLLYTLADNWNEFHFRKGDIDVKMPVSGIMNANDGQLICAAARDGFGILAQPAYIIQADLESGNLVRVLEDWDLPRLTMNIAFPSKSLLPTRTRLFIDFLIEHFKKHDYERLWTE